MTTPVTDGVEFQPSQRLKLDDRAKHLARLPLFADVSRRHLRSLARASRQVLLEPGANLFTEGAPPTDAYVIVAGSARVHRGNRTIATLGAGDVVGELGLLLERPRNATATALTPLDVLAIARDDLRAAVLTTPELGWVLLETVAQRLSPKGV